MFPEIGSPITRFTLITPLQVAVTNQAFPFTLDLLPLAGAVVNQGVSSVVAFRMQGAKIGVIWSNEIDNKYYFASHLVDNRV
jgi:hypothetical protein